MSPRATNPSAPGRDRLTRDMARSMRIIAHVQVMVEWVEIILVFLTTAEVVHLLTAEVENWPEPPHLWKMLTTLGAAVLAAVCVALLLQPWRNKAAGHEEEAAPAAAGPDRKG